MPSIRLTHMFPLHVLYFVHLSSTQGGKIKEKKGKKKKDEDRRNTIVYMIPNVQSMEVIC